MTSSTTLGNVRLLDRLLEEQGQLTAVERFARTHTNPGSAPEQARYYRALIPLQAPRPGEQYAFAVDLDSCTGCKACVSACHALNGLDEHETWRSTGLLKGGTVAEPYQQVVTSACHHCLEPACLNGCPVLAYEKDSATGIVRHLDDQCIGCQYCILKCPYDVPQYSPKRGIVRKCDMCHSRLAAQEAPACVQACPNGAISIRVTSQAQTARDCSEPRRQLLPGTVSSSYTQPTSVYTTRRALPANTQPADAQAIRSEPAHWPLVWMLLLTQTAVGMILALAASVMWEPQLLAKSGNLLLSAACLMLHAGLLISVLHLGRPSGAWRAFLGWRRSWMSREILAFGALSVASVMLVLVGWVSPPLHLRFAMIGGTAGLGLVAVFASAMIYIDTRRPFWRAANTVPRFFGATLVLGASAAASLCSWIAWFSPSNATAAVQACGIGALVVRSGLFLWEAFGLSSTLRDAEHPSHRSALVIWRGHRSVVLSHVALIILFTASGLGGLAAGSAAAVASTTVCWLTAFTAALLERYLFFVAAAGPKMPGGSPA